MDLIRGVLLRLLLLASSLGPGAAPLRSALRKQGNAVSAPGSTTSGAPGSPSPARTRSWRPTFSLTPDPLHLTGFFSAQSLEETRTSPSPFHPRRFQGYLFVERRISFPDTVEVEGSVFDRRELSCGSDHTVSIRRIATVQEKSNGSSCVSKQLIEFILSRAQPFPVECLKICLVCPVPISGPSHALCRDVASDVRGFLHSGCFLRKELPVGLFYAVF